jgi:hypothetical protein
MSLRVWPSFSFRNEGYDPDLVFQRLWRVWSWSYCSWIYNYMCNQCLLPLQLWILFPLMLRSTRYNIMIKLVSDFRQVDGFLHQLNWQSRYNWNTVNNTITTTPFMVRSTRYNSMWYNKTDGNDITEIMLKVALNTIIIVLTYHCLTPIMYIVWRV